MKQRFRNEDLKGLGASLGLHLALLLISGALIIGSKNPEHPAHLVEIEFGSLASEARPSAPSPNPDPRPPQPEMRPEPPRAQQEAPTPVRTPQTRNPAQGEETIARPQQQPDTPPQPPSPATPERNTDGGGGTPTGEQGNDSNPDDASGRGNTGSSGVAIEGLGNRRASCPRPGHPGVNGFVSYFVTFTPEGRYVSSRPQRRGGNPRLDQAARSVLVACRAQPLPSNADQVNQQGLVTFRFTN